MGEPEVGVSSRPASDITCISESAYSSALTRGRKYAVLDLDENKEQVKIKGDNERSRWFPTYCFDFSGRDVPLLAHMAIRGTIEEPQTAWIEVDVELSDGQRRWCFFATPDTLTDIGKAQVGADGIIMYGAPHMIVVTSMSEDVIRHALEYIDGQGELTNCTRSSE